MSHPFGIRGRSMSGRSRKPVLLVIPPLVLSLCSHAWAAARPTTQTAGCVADGCHDNYQSRKHMHGPVAFGVCKFCHRAVDPTRHTFKLLREGSQLCESCHWDRDVEASSHHFLGGRECTGCHNPHGTDYESLLSAPTAAEVCRGCHDRLLEGKQFLHSPVAAGECALCHELHESDRCKLLKADPEQLCFVCHEKMKDEIGKFEHVHKPVKEKNCTACIPTERAPSTFWGISSTNTACAGSTSRRSSANR